MKISVIMSIYSEPIEWILEAIDSILNQTFSDFEFIIINDKPDRKENAILLSEYQKKDNRIVVVQNEENIGLTKSLNKGLKLAKGKYIARMDADDISMPTRFEKQFAFMEKNEGVVACSSWIETFGRRKSYWRLEADDYSLKTHFLVPSPITTPLCHPASFIKNITLQEYHISYDETISSAQDYDFWRQLLKVGKLANINEVLLQYRLSDGNISSTKSIEQKNNARLIRRKYINTMLNQLDIDYCIPHQISLNDIKQFKKIIRKASLKAIEKANLNNLLISMYMSLPIYDVKVMVYYLFSGDCLMSNIPFKERIRVPYRCIKRDSQSSYL